MIKKIKTKKRFYFKQQLISVIIPVYNVEKYIEKCLQSVIKQTYRNLEIILIDDGSTDNSLKVCQNFKKLDKRIKVFSQKNCGVSSARNLGISKARGAYIGFIDSDDWIEHDFFFTLYRNIILSKADISIINYQKVYAQSIKIENETETVTEKQVLSPYKALILCNSNESFQGFLWNKLFSNKFFNKCDSMQYFDTEISICEDLLWSSYCILQSKKIVYDSRKKYYYLIRNESAYWSPFNKNKISELDAREKIAQMVQETLPEISGYLVNIFLNRAIDLIIIMTKEDKNKYKNEIKKIVCRLKKYKKWLRNSEISLRVKLYSPLLFISANLFCRVYNGFVFLKRICEK
ncbi:glycosyltransferase family 2 protein [Eubacterium maltosivorans]|uniref:Glycosyltransferase family 2 protein n=1 Tax=Eubacterium maltosivorans TaxID=2041044 RepID=A0A4P9C6H1_EUBML|nr:glycosyltransferase family 2 protein [Eubacterium maltosivorans]QCT70192.1 glycosyltransferase family 2 protein [Eubacterium maltosivorans]